MMSAKLTTVIGTMLAIAGAAIAQPSGTTARTIKGTVTTPLGVTGGGRFWGPQWFSPYVGGSIGTTAYANTTTAANTGIKYTSAPGVTRTETIDGGIGAAGARLHTSVTCVDASPNFFTGRFNMTGSVSAKPSKGGVAAVARGGMNDPMQLLSLPVGEAQPLTVTLDAGTQMQKYTPGYAPVPVSVNGRFAKTGVNTPSDLWFPSAGGSNIMSLFNISVFDTGSGLDATYNVGSLPAGYGYSLSFTSAASSVMAALKSPSNWTLSGDMWTLNNTITAADCQLTTMTASLAGTQTSLGVQYETGAIATPTPGSVSLLAVGGLLATRRRR